MADTIAAVTVTDAWQSVSSLTGIVAGTACTIQNQGSHPVMAVISIAEPAAGFNGWLIPASRLDQPMVIPAGESEVWLKVDWAGVEQLVSIQEG